MVMKATRFFLFIFLMASVTVLLAPGWMASPGNQSALAQEAKLLDTQPVTNQELVRNGGFDYDKTAWATNPTWTQVGDGYGKDGVGKGMQIGTEFSDNYGYIYQELYLPTQTTGATFSFDYQFVPGQEAALGYFRAVLATASSTLATLVSVEAATYPGETWQSANISLNATDLSALNAAHAAGQRVYLMIDLSAQFLQVNVDNVSFKVSGSMTYPTWSGSIAYIGWDNEGNARTVNRIDPDGSNGQTLWTHPGTISAHIYDLAWKPDASELAFSSDHEFVYSAFHADVYGIKPDGSGLRRITNPPSKAALDAGGYQVGAVTGKIYNSYGTASPFLVYIEGAKEVVSVDVGGHGSEVSFRVDNVADLGNGYSHYVVFGWSDLSHDCANGKEYAAAIVDVAAGQTVDAGTLTFFGYCHEYNVRSISWRHDGSQVGFFVSSFPKKVPTAGQTLGDDLFDVGTVFAQNLAWSPVDDQILYHRQTFDTNSGIYLTAAGGGIGNRLVSDSLGYTSALYANPAWLPDGSGFVYSLDHYLYQYDLASSQIITLAVFYNEYALNPSLSPDGQYIVFERESIGGASIQRDLWIINRTNPLEMWPLTNDGKSSNPDWSRAKAPADCTAITDVTVSGDTGGVTGQAYAFTASVNPITATTPITYTWSPEPDSGQNTPSASYTWATEGTKIITVTVENCGGTKVDTHTIEISAPQPGCPKPLSAVSIDGPTTGYTNTAYTFSAAITPPDATRPITYTWSPEPDSGQSTPNAGYKWTTPSTKTITLNAQNCGGTKTDSHEIIITAVKYRIYLPIVLRNG